MSGLASEPDAADAELDSCSVFVSIRLPDDSAVDAATFESLLLHDRSSEAITSNQAEQQQLLMLLQATDVCSAQDDAADALQTDWYQAPRAHTPLHRTGGPDGVQPSSELREVKSVLVNLAELTSPLPSSECTIPLSHSDGHAPDANPTSTAGLFATAASLRAHGSLADLEGAADGDGNHSDDELTDTFAAHEQLQQHPAQQQVQQRTQRGPMSLAAILAGMSSGSTALHSSPHDVPAIVPPLAPPVQIRRSTLLNDEQAGALPMPMVLLPESNGCIRSAVADDAQQAPLRALPYAATTVIAQSAADANDTEHGAELQEALQEAAGLSQALQPAADMRQQRDAVAAAARRAHEQASAHAAAAHAAAAERDDAVQHAAALQETVDELRRQRDAAVAAAQRARKAAEGNAAAAAAEAAEEWAAAVEQLQQALAVARAQLRDAAAEARQARGDAAYARALLQAAQHALRRSHARADQLEAALEEAHARMHVFRQEGASHRGTAWGDPLQLPRSPLRQPLSPRAADLLWEYDDAPPHSGEYDGANVGSGDSMSGSRRDSALPQPLSQFLAAATGRGGAAAATHDDQAGRQPPMAPRSARQLRGAQLDVHVVDSGSDGPAEAAAPRRSAAYGGAARSSATARGLPAQDASGGGGGGSGGGGVVDGSGGSSGVRAAAPPPPMCKAHSLRSEGVRGALTAAAGSAWSADARCRLYLLTSLRGRAIQMRRSADWASHRAAAAGGAAAAAAAAPRQDAGVRRSWHAAAHTGGGGSSGAARDHTQRSLAGGDADEPAAAAAAALMWPHGAGAVRGGGGGMDGDAGAGRPHGSSARRDDGEDFAALERQLMAVNMEKEQVRALAHVRNGICSGSNVEIISERLRPVGTFFTAPAGG
ncbi:hypothetical protein JKP88DRAFT_250567 [Tribonema minus]|uniref:Uncharacterized protein n=1 Tax=Tribonema minus TaxID=303371 RepID=A0A835YJD6_9STRA|nr:hypothetical protein JKP88DRAFT_250567 [Tribonema minus]